MLENRLAASVEPSTCGVSVVGARAPARTVNKKSQREKRAMSPDLYVALVVPGPVRGTRALDPAELWCHAQVRNMEKKEKKSKKNCFFPAESKKNAG